MKGDKRMYKIGMTGVLLIALGACNMERPIETRIKENPSTFCNPLNLDYRFMKIDGGNGIREAADPVVTHFKGQYFYLHPNHPVTGILRISVPGRMSSCLIQCFR